MIHLMYLALLQVALVSGLSAPSPAVDDYDVLQYVNPLIGSTNGGITSEGFLNARVSNVLKAMSLLERQSLMAWPKL